MKELIIKAHPSSKGFTHKIAENYRVGAESAGKETVIIDLYNEEWKQDYFIFEDIKKIPADPKREKIQKLIIDSDGLVFIFPMWWYDSPAVMKNFIDTNFISGFAYENKKNRIKGLLKGKTAKVFITCGAPKILYWLMLMPFRTIWSIGRLRFCGIKVTKFMLFDKMNSRSGEDKEKWLKKIKKLGSK